MKDDNTFSAQKVERMYVLNLEHRVEETKNKKSLGRGSDIMPEREPRIEMRGDHDHVHIIEMFRDGQFTIPTIVL